MLYYDIHSYSDFKRLFGLEVHGNGAKSRKNKILLQHLKNKALLQWCIKNNDLTLLHIRSMADLKQTVLLYIRQLGEADPNLPNKVKLMGNTYYSYKYRTDELEGLCEDFDKKAVRYVNTSTGHIYKMKAGKFFTSIIKENELGLILSEQVINWLSEEFTQDWQTFSIGQTPEVEFHVDDNFSLIYDEDACRDFDGCSCMVGRNRHGFYENSVDAKAAYLLDKDGYVLSRAIIFTDVTDSEGNNWRLLERQYARESNDVLKRLLIDCCIKGGHIDGYKQVGAGCSEANAFVANDGSSLAHKKFSIRCELGIYDVLSYQDSFKYYDSNNEIAFNHADVRYNYNLDTTDYNLEAEEDENDLEYDEYHDCDVENTTLVFYHGAEIYCDTERLEDFVWIESIQAYHHYEDVTQCDNCGEWLLKASATYNTEAEAYFCDQSCEDQYIREHYSEYDARFYPSKDDLTTIMKWDDETQNYKRITISYQTLEDLKGTGQVIGRGETWILLPEAITCQVA